MKPRPLFLFASLICLCFLIALFENSVCEAMGAPKDWEGKIEKQYQKINTADGISKDEASLIAQNFLIEDGFTLSQVNILKPKVYESSLVDGCWAVGFDASFKVRWEQGLKWYSLHIDKKTGQIKSQGWGPA